MIDPKTEQRLINGDEAALDEIIEAASPVISATLSNFTGGALPAADIEEITADAFITLWYNRHKLRVGHCAGYLMTIAKNKARNKIRDNKLRTALDIEDTVIEDEFRIADGIERDEAAQALLQALDTLGEPDREMLLRRYFYYQNSNQIGQAMDTNARTVRTRLRRAKEKLREILSERGFIL